MEGPSSRPRSGTVPGKSSPPRSPGHRRTRSRPPSRAAAWSRAWRPVWPRSPRGAGAGSAEAVVTVPDLPLTGDRGARDCASFDRIIPALMVKWGIPGGAVAVVKDGSLVYSRGYGYADLATATPTRGRCPLPAGEHLQADHGGGDPHAGGTGAARSRRAGLRVPARPDRARPGTTRDARINGVTVRQLLWHVGGWDRNLSGDPMFNPIGIAQALGIPAPAGCEGVMRFMLGPPARFRAGDEVRLQQLRLLCAGPRGREGGGRTVRGLREVEVLAPLGITRMRIGSSIFEGPGPRRGHLLRPRFDPVDLRRRTGPGTVWRVLPGVVRCPGRLDRLRAGPAPLHDGGRWIPDPARHAAPRDGGADADHGPGRLGRVSLLLRDGMAAAGRWRTTGGTTARCRERRRCWYEPGTAWRGPRSSTRGT